MKQEYERVVRVVCGDDWCGQHKTPDEKDGGFGIAMVLAFLRGTPARLAELSKEIDVPHYVIEIPFRRLHLNGIFNDWSWVLTEPLLKGESRSADDAHRAMLIWCHIAGLSSGFTGKGLTRPELSERKKHRNDS
tara:strand:- start:20820 stop:21221 length:402 start_codon:yes stop_codon:yes gene_type:complete